MDVRFGNLRYRTRETGVTSKGQYLKAGRFQVYFKSSGLEHPDSGDVLAHVTIPGLAQKFERCWDALHGRPPYLTGGPFTKAEFETPNFLVQGSGTWELGDYDSWGTQGIRYTGGFCNPYWHPSWASDMKARIDGFGPGVTDSYFRPNDLRSLGNSAYNKLRPKVDMGGLGQAIAEIRDIPETLHTTGGGFASLWQRLNTWRDASFRRRDWKMGPKAAADQFVNHEFGWLPFIRDVVDLCGNIVDNHDRIAKKKADNNKWKRRLFREQIIETEEVLAELPFIGCEPADSLYFKTDRNISSQQPYTLSVQTLNETWYEGQFKYYYPEFDDNSWWSGYPALQTVMQNIDLFGARVDPVLLYKTTPWTWMVDWFSDVGAGIQRLQDIATDSTVSKYFYLMQHRVFRVRVRSRFSTTDGKNHDYSWYYGGEIKDRETGDSPFGFNLKSVDLSPTQLGILGALGLSKGLGG